MVVMVRNTAAIEAAFGQKRLVEQRHACGDQSVEGSRQGEHPERRARPVLRRAYGSASRSGSSFSASGHLFRRPRFAHQDQAKTPNAISIQPDAGPERSPIGVKCLDRPPSRPANAAMKPSGDQERVDADRQRRVLAPPTLPTSARLTTDRRSGRDRGSAGRARRGRAARTTVRSAAEKNPAWPVRAPRAARLAHGQNDRHRGRSDDREGQPHAEAVDHPADWQAERAADQRGPEVEGGERHSVEAEVGQESVR